MTEKERNRCVEVLEDCYVMTPTDFDRMSYHNRTIDYIINYFLNMEVANDRQIERS